jgi:hypothetical protein
MVKRKGVLHRNGGNELVVEHSEQKRNDTMVLAAPQIPFRVSIGTGNGLLNLSGLLAAA